MADREQGRRPKNRPGGADSKLPGWHPEEKATQLPEEVLSNQRGLRQRIAKGRDPKTLERAVTLREGIVAYSLCKPTSYFL